MNARAAPKAAGHLPGYLVKGDDPSLVNEAAHDLVAELVGEDDPSLVVEEYAAGEVDIVSVVDACSTQSMLSSSRVVVLRGAGRMSAHEGEQIAAYLKSPAPGTALVIVAAGGTVPVKVANAVKKVGRVVDANPGTGRARTQWIAERLRSAPVNLDRAAADRLSDHLGDDLGRLSGLLGALAAAYGESSKVTLAKLEPFLATAGSVPSWDLTDAIDVGDVPRAMTVLHRMLGAGGMHPLAVMAVLHTHYSRMLRLDGADVSTAEQAVALLGVRSPFVAGKVLAQGRRLGSARIAQAILLLASADLDLRGVSALDPELVAEVLVARLSRLSGHSSRSRPATGGRLRGGARPAARRS